MSDTTAQKRKPFEQQPAFKESSEILKRQKRLSRYQKKAETEQLLDKLIPDALPSDFKEDTGNVEHITVEVVEKAEEGTKRTIYKQQKPAKQEYLYKHNPNLKHLLNVGHAKIYFDLDTRSYWLYCFSVDMKQIKTKIELKRHDIMNLLAFCLADIYLKNPPKTLWINKKLKAKISIIGDKLDAFMV